MDLHHLTAIISVVRHGEKDDAGELTELGKLQAQARGLATKFLNGEVKLYHSGVGRVEKTIRALADKIFYTADDYMLDRAREDASKFGTDECIADLLPELHYDLDAQKKSVYFSSWSGILPEKEANCRMQEFLNYKNASPEPGVAPAPIDVAKRVARVVYSQANQALSTPYREKVNFINGTHEPVIMSFLYYAFNGFKPGDENFVEEIGGSVNFAEGFEVHVYEKDSGDYKCYLEFRDVIEELDLKKLSAFVGKVA